MMDILQFYFRVEQHTKIIKTQKNNPKFVNYPLPCTSGAAINYASGFDFHLATGSPALGAGNTSFTPMTSPVPVDPVFGVTKITSPGKDIGCYQADGSGNQH